MLQKGQFRRTSELPVAIIWSPVIQVSFLLELVRVSWYYYSTFAVFIPEVAFGILCLDAFEYITDVA